MDFKNLETLARTFKPEPTGNVLLDSRYDWQKNTNGAEWPYYRFFYHLAWTYKPKVVLELGTYQGTAAAHFAAGNPETYVITVDHHSDPGDDDNQLKVLEVQDEFSNIYYFQGWTTPYLAETQRGNHALGNTGDVYQRIVNALAVLDAKIDILFIDSWHCYEYAKMDYETYCPLLSPGGLIICDDIQAGGGPQDPIQGMLQFWDELPEPKFLNANLHPGTNMGFVY